MNHDMNNAQRSEVNRERNNPVVEFHSNIQFYFCQNAILPLVNCTTSGLHERRKTGSENDEVILAADATTGQLPVLLKSRLLISQHGTISYRKTIVTTTVTAMTTIASSYSVPGIKNA